MWITPHRCWSKPATTRKAETENQPAMEIHLGETSSGHGQRQRQRHAIIWINGRRWEGELHLQEAGT